MDFEKKFLHPTKSNEVILVKWTKGYREVEIWFHDELIHSMKGAKLLLKGVSFFNEKLRDVKIILSENPYYLNIIVNKFHSKNNLLHPAKKNKNVGNWFILPALISLFGVITAIDGLLSNSYINKTGIQFMFGFYGILFILYVTTIVLSRLRIYLFFFISYAIFVVFGLMLIYSIFNSLQYGHLDIGTIILLILYLAYITGITFALNKIIVFLKHKRVQENQHDTIIDN